VEEVEDAGFQLFSPSLENIGPTVSLLFGQNSSMIERKLRSRRVIVSARGPGVRFAHHFFNDRGQVDRVVDILKRHFRKNYGKC
jgi:kynureninase